MRTPLDPFDLFRETIGKLTGNGIILVAGDHPNPMTIGWATLGEIWHRPVMTVLVRPTRFTYALMEKSRDFSVCVLGEAYEKHLAFCGTKSGRDHDKIRVCGFTMEPGIRISTPYIAESDFHFECRMIYKQGLNPDALDPSINEQFYPRRDWHTVYFGEIEGAFRK